MDRKNRRLRDVLAENLRALKTADGTEESQSSLHRRSGVAQATIGRILSKGGENARIETVEKLAKAYGLRAWQLLIPGMEPKNPRFLGASSPEEKALYDRLQATVEDLAKLKKE